MLKGKKVQKGHKKLRRLLMGERGEEEQVSTIADEFVRGRGVIDAHVRQLKPAQRP